MDLQRYLTSVREKQGIVSGTVADADWACEVSQDLLVQVEFFFLFFQQVVFLCPWTKDQPKLLFIISLILANLMGKFRCKMCFAYA